MGNRDRHSKYGKTKWFDRLRRAKIGPRIPHGSVIRSFTPHNTHRQRSIQAIRVSLRPPGQSDAEFIACLSRQVFNIYGPYDETVPEWLESERVVTVIADMERAPVGFAMLGDPFNKYDTHRVSELLALAVDPKKHRQGIGGILLREMEVKANELKIRRIFLHTAIENQPARKLFTCHGYKPWEIKQSFYPAGQDAVVMSRETWNGP
ncbi:MAG: GNAT family N-acetyltransferase [Deltaproteobacteria bacterium]|nr:GNAT family N-acetyltransferase [Deltaproteobacteria bacterium]